MTNSTPGPWGMESAIDDSFEAAYASFGPLEAIPLLGGDGDLVALIPVGEDLNEVMADAFMLAAAPDMYSALLGFVVPAGQSLEELIANAKRVLAAARGEAAVTP